MLQALAGALLFLMPTFLVAALAGEVEPNNTPATANPLPQHGARQIDGAIEPAGDVDYFRLDGLSISFGFVAILDTSESTASQQGVLTAYAADGTTVLQSDAGSWVDGSVIAWQSQVNGAEPYYVRVGEVDDDQPITPYRLRYYSVIIMPQPEVEPNDAPAAANTSSATNAGTIGAAGDTDCYAFWGTAGNSYSVILNADPENDGGDTDFALALYAPDGTLLRQADTGGAGHNELIDSVGLAATGPYTYCVSASGGTAGPSASYVSGLLGGSGNYYPPAPISAVWTNPRADRPARVSDLLSFTLAVTNATSLPMPGTVGLYARPNPDCMSLVSAPAATSASSSEVTWDTTGLAPYEAFSASFTVRAISTCSGWLRYGAILNYSGVGLGTALHYTIDAGATYLPLVRR